jgi:hypothetical protein
VEVEVDGPDADAVDAAKGNGGVDSIVDGEYGWMDDGW